MGASKDLATVIITRERFEIKHQTKDRSVTVRSEDPEDVIDEETTE